MATEIKVPVLGESIVEATIGKWFKQVGESFAVDESLVELETDKVTIEVPAPSAGTLSEIFAKEGENVEVGALLAIIEEGATKSKSAAPAAPATKVPEKSNSSSMPPSPAAGKLLKEKGLAAADVSGSGKRGQILKSDVQDANAQTAPATTSAPATQDQGPREERVRMSRLRQTIARRLKEAQDTAAMLTTFNEVDMGAVMDMRTNTKNYFKRSTA